MLTRQKFVHDI